MDRRRVGDGTPQQFDCRRLRKDEVGGAATVVEALDWPALDIRKLGDREDHFVSVSGGHDRDARAGAAGHRSLGPAQLAVLESEVAADDPLPLHKSDRPAPPAPPPPEPKRRAEG